MLKEIEEIEDISEQMIAEERLASALYQSINHRKNLMKILFKPEAEDYLFAIDDKLFRFLEYIAKEADLMKLIDQIEYRLHKRNKKLIINNHLTEKEIFRALERESKLKNNHKKGGRINHVERAIYLCMKEPNRTFEIINFNKEEYKLSNRSIYRIKKGIKEQVPHNCKKMFCFFELQEEIYNRNELTRPCLYNYVP